MRGFYYIWGTYIDADIPLPWSSSTYLAHAVERSGLQVGECDAKGADIIHLGSKMALENECFYISC